jgi:hypothetical protein
MYLVKATLLGLGVFAISLALGGRAWAGPLTYQWVAIPSGDLLEVVGTDPAGYPIIESLPLGPGVVQITYGPDPYARSSPGPDRDSTYFTASTFQFWISIGPGFGGAPDFDAGGGNIEIIAPPRGGGLDMMIFYGIEHMHDPGRGYVAILAPNGTLADSTEMPADLSAFEAYGRDHPGGSFNLTWGNGYNYPFYLWGIDGQLATSPEPATFVSMTTGMSILLCAAEMSRRRRRRACGREPAIVVRMGHKRL